MEKIMTIMIFFFFFTTTMMRDRKKPTMMMVMLMAAVMLMITMVKVMSYHAHISYPCSVTCVGLSGVGGGGGLRKKKKQWTNGQGAASWNDQLVLCPCVNRYHLGSLAFGSFIIAVVQMIRIILEYIDHKLKGSENQVAKFFLK